MLLLLKNKTRS